MTEGEGFHANPLTAQPIGAQLITLLQEGQGHPFGFLTGAIHPRHTIEHLQATAAWRAEGSTITV